MDMDKVFAKIERCLALSESSNEHEAAAAMRQARKLMDKYNVDAEAIKLSKIELFKARSTDSGRIIPRYFGALAVVVSKAFNVRCMMHRTNTSKWITSGSITFYGPAADAEVAAYCFDTLFTQIHYQRKQYMKTFSGSPQYKQKLAAVFCEGWVDSVHNIVLQFAGEPDPERESVLNTFRDTQLNLRAPRARRECTLSNDEYRSLQAGSEYGKNAKLFHGATDQNKQGQHLLIGGK